MKHYRMIILVGFIVDLKKYLDDLYDPMKKKRGVRNKGRLKIQRIRRI